jgi:hypothetical protein
MEINIDILTKLVNFGLTNLEIAKELETSRSTIVRLKSKYKLKSKINENKKDEFCCLNCKKSFTSLKSDNRKFCSQSCSAIFNNIKRGDRLIDKNENMTKKHDRVFIICNNCDKQHEIKRKEISKPRKYCSTKCQKDFEKKLRYKQIEIGENLGSKAVKKYLIFKNGEKCMKCGWCEKNPITNKVPIELEHIDGNSENNNLDNLELLCPNCHSLTSTYKALNKGKGRHKRRERYKEGKSY